MIWVGCLAQRRDSIHVGSFLLLASLYRAGACELLAKSLSSIISLNPHVPLRNYSPPYRPAWGCPLLFLPFFHVVLSTGGPNLPFKKILSAATWTEDGGGVGWQCSSEHKKARQEIKVAWTRKIVADVLILNVCWRQNQSAQLIDWTWADKKERRVYSQSWVKTWPLLDNGCG